MKRYDSRMRPEWLRSSTRLVFVMFAIALTILTFKGIVSADQFMTAWAGAAGFFRWIRRKDWTNPEWDDKNFYNSNPTNDDNNGRKNNWGDDTP